MSFFWKGRLGEKPSDLLKHYYAETMREPLFLEALHQWDKAHVVVLGEQGIAPPDAVASLGQHDHWRDSHLLLPVLYYATETEGKSIRSVNCEALH